ncbi:MAG: methionine--tRNA ligase [Clostridia bacterium]|nr:methionine--tRNA ligase [Clostridia bacterium]
MKEKYYITTAITYTSGKPHIGNTYEIILSDAIARFKRLQGYDVRFQTGTDEHGLKIEQKAAEKGMEPKAFVDSIVDVIKGIWDRMNISYDRFMRTTDSYHERTVQKMFKKFYDQGDIYKSTYEGWYCTPCESFWTESQLVDGKCPDCGREVKLAKEETYFFRMSKYAPALVKHILTHPKFIQPASRKNEMMNNFLLADEFIGKSDAELLEACENGTIKCKLQDLCVSRSTFKWGIPVDFDPKHVVYVWLDALTNYITGLGYDPDGSSEMYKKYWPANVHVIGKDIVRFHSIYWPIFLMALGEPIPETVFGHPWLMQGGDKMSKSKGNVIYADDLADIYGVDATRYFVLHEMPYADDGIITWELMTERCNSDLANILGNLVKRTVTMANKYFGGTVRKTDTDHPEDADLAAVAEAARDKVAAKMEEFRVADALDALWTLLRRANKYIDETEPWILARTSETMPRLEGVLYNLLAAIELGATLLKPFMPDTADKIFAEIGGTEREWDTLATFAYKDAYTVSKEPATLFERLNHKDIQPMIDKISAAQIAAAAPQKPVKDQITIDDFAKIDMRVGKVVACEPVKKSKLLHETIDIGGGKCISVLSGIAQHYTADEMVGKSVVVVVNLPPREMKGLISEGMIICAEGPDGTLSVVSAEKDLPTGSTLS